MTHHTNDTFGNEASRPQDAIPLEETRHNPAEPESQPPGDLKDLAELAETSQERSQASPAGETPPARAQAQRPPRRKSARAKKARAQQSAPLDANDALQDLHDLAACGFSEDEARRLIDISDRVTQSAEAREAEATMRRLRFTRWLVEHGMLDEWSA